MSTLKVSFIQSNIYWQDISANLAMLEEMIWAIDKETDVILLPEMFNTGFSMEAEQYAEPLNFNTYKWMVQMAKQKQALIIGSYIVKESGKFFNRLFCVKPDGQSEYYDKRHLFRMGDEHLTYSPGQKQLIVNYRGWKIMPQVCYDLRFPVWSRNTIDPKTESPKYDLLLYVANWPAPRTEVWNTLLKARAIENQCYCAGVNRIGSDGMKVTYNGHSAIYDFKGQLMNQLSSDATVHTTELHLHKLKEFRMKFPAYLDGDTFSL